MIYPSIVYPWFKGHLFFPEFSGFLFFIVSKLKQVQTIEQSQPNLEKIQTVSLGNILSSSVLKQLKDEQKQKKKKTKFINFPTDN